LGLEKLRLDPTNKRFSNISLVLSLSNDKGMILTMTRLKKGDAVSANYLGWLILVGISHALKSVVISLSKREQLQVKFDRLYSQFRL
jgi:hypothetical protein